MAHFLLVFSQNSGSGLYMDFSRGYHTIIDPPHFNRYGADSGHYSYTIPEDGYICGQIHYNSYKPRWVNVKLNGVDILSFLGINTESSSSIPFIAVKKGDFIEEDCSVKSATIYYCQGRVQFDPFGRLKVTQ